MKNLNEMTYTDLEKMTYAELEQFISDGEKQEMAYEAELKMLSIGYDDDVDGHFDGTIYSDKNRAYELKSLIWHLRDNVIWAANHRYAVRKHEERDKREAENPAARVSREKKELKRKINYRKNKLAEATIAIATMEATFDDEVAKFIASLQKDLADKRSFLEETHKQLVELEKQLEELEK